MSTTILIADFDGSQSTGRRSSSVHIELDEPKDQLRRTALVEEAVLDL